MPISFKIRVAILSFTIMATLPSCLPVHRNSIYYRPQLAEKPLKQEKEKKARIYPKNDQNFLLHFEQSKIWTHLVDLLLQNYNLALVDHKTGVMTTEWNTFYLKGIAYRNKISIRLNCKLRKTCQMSLFNKTENYIRENGSQGSWQAAKDSMLETTRLMLNLAILLKEQHIILPPKMELAKRELQKTTKNEF